MLRRLLALLLPTAAVLPLPGCAWWFFSGGPTVDRSRPVALVETTGGVELGATTEFGILTLGSTADAGPCRVHYFLGPTPMIEDGQILSSPGVFCLADIDLRTQLLRVHDRPLRPEDPLVAMWTPDGRTVETVDVRLARSALADGAAGIEGDVLEDPGRPLPHGATILTIQEGDYHYVGLVSGRGLLGPDRRVFYTFAGLDRVREALATPEVFPKDYRIKFRPDDIVVRKPIR